MSARGTMVAPCLRRLPWLTLVILYCVLPVGRAQFGLISPRIAFLSSGPRTAPLMSVHPSAADSNLSQPGERQPEPRRGSYTRESEIAAIFKGVAYGAPTQEPNSSNAASDTTTTTTTTTTTSSSTTSSSPAASHPYHVVQGTASGVGVGWSVVELLPSSTLAPSSGPSSNVVTYLIQNTFNGSEAGDAMTSPANDLVQEGPTKALNKGGTGASGAVMGEVRAVLGAAWFVHVYVCAGLLALLAAAALCCMAYAASTPDLPRPTHLAVHALVCLASTLRSIHLFHDPYSVGRRLPLVVATALEEVCWPCITASLSVLVVLLLGCGRCTTRPHAALIMGLLAALHATAAFGAHLAAQLLPGHAFALQLVARAVTATWGLGVGITGVWAVWRVEECGGWRRGQLLGRASRFGTCCGYPSLHHAVRLAVLAIVAQIVLAILHLYILVAPLDPTTHAWAWWVRVSLGRTLEVVAGLGLVTSAALLVRGRPSHTRPENTIFSVFTSCGREARTSKGGRSANVFPANSDKQHILGSFTLRPSMPLPLDHSLKTPPPNWSCSTQRDQGNGIHSISSEFQLLWNRDRSQSAGGLRSSSMLVNDSGFVRFRTQVDPEQDMDDVLHQSSLRLHQVASPVHYRNTCNNYSSSTLPPSRYYCTTSTAPTSPRGSPAKYSTTRVRRPHPKGGSVHPGSSLPPASASRVNMHNFDDYEVASYYHHTGSISGSSNMYSTPHPPSPALQVLPGVHRGRHSQATGEGAPVTIDSLSGVLEPSTCSSLSEIHVDYLTDVSSSNDAVHLGCFPGPRQHPHQHQHMLTLPISPHYPRVPPRAPVPIPPTPVQPATSDQQPDITPDSAVALDFNSAEEDVEPLQQASDLLHLSCSSLSEVERSQSGGRGSLLSKLMGSNLSVSCYGYSPLDVEDVSSPSQEVPVATGAPAMRRTVSFSDLQPRAVSKLPQSPDTVTPL